MNITSKQLQTYTMYSAVLLFLILFQASCSSTPELGPPPPVVSPENMKLVLSPGDEIEIKFAYAEQFNELQVIRPDGNIELQFIGEVKASGKTPSELREELKERFSTHLKHPQLAVVVRNFSEQRVYVAGKVNEPGVIPMPQQMTALEAIMYAGGFDIQFAKTSNVIVIRHTGNQRKGYAVNLKKSLRGEQVDTFMLQPRDIVYVPRSTITKLNDFMEQYSNKMVPDIGLTFTRSLGRTSYGYDSDSDN